MNEKILIELIEAQRLNIELLHQRLDIANDRISNLFDHITKK
jgi:hypothetical protein|tara:strand:+ start:610 stop:735 length:126 start_codon:yes stop_codon:yes gene_type:complete